MQRLILMIILLLSLSCESKSSPKINNAIDVDITHQNKKSTVKIKLTDAEIVFLKQINELYPEIRFSDTAFEIYENNIHNLQLDFQNYLGSNNLFFDEYIDYRVAITDADPEFKVDYTYSVGQAFSAVGHIYLNKITKEIIRIEYSYGTGSSTTEVSVNGKIIFEKEHSF